MTRMPEPIDYDIAIPSDAAGIVRLLATAFSESEFRKLGFADRLSVSYADFRFQMCRSLARFRATSAQS
jgi:hypothetical protein